MFVVVALLGMWAGGNRFTTTKVGNWLALADPARDRVQLLPVCIGTHQWAPAERPLLN